MAAMRDNARQDVFPDGALRTRPVQPESCHGTRIVTCWRESCRAPLIILVPLRDGLCRKGSFVSRVLEGRPLETKSRRSYRALPIDS